MKIRKLGKAVPTKKWTCTNCNSRLLILPKDLKRVIQDGEIFLEVVCMACGNFHIFNLSELTSEMKRAIGIF